MELAKSFDPHAIEAKWYPLWESRGYFKPSLRPARRRICILLPPPNVTGTLHMGHAFQQTLMDVLIRYHRMRGDNTLWQLGTDHAGIATQIVVESQLAAPKARRAHDLGREKFVERVWAVEGGIRLDDHAADAPPRRVGRLVARALHDGRGPVRRRARDVRAPVRRGLIYRGKRLVNWDPKLGTAVSDLEVESEEEQGKLWQIRYPLRRRQRVAWSSRRRGPRRCSATSRSRCNPEDERYTALVGKAVTLPLTGRTIPVIADDYVDREFGTGCVKITPAHDFNDWQIGQRHRLAPISIFTLDATINENAPAKYRGLDRFDARKAVLADLAAAGLLVSEKPHKMVVPRCERTGEVVEPMLTDQWFVAMTHAGAGGASVLSGQVDPGSLPRGGRRRRSRARATGETARSSSCPRNGCRRTCTGSTTSRTGASRASSGGATGFRRGTTRPATSTSRATRPKRARRRRRSSVASRRRSRRTTTCSTPGSRPRCGLSTLGWPATETTRAARRSCRRRCWSPASTSSSSGSRAW